LGEYDKALSDYNKAIELLPRYAKAYNNRGYIYRKKGEYDHAIADYSKAIEIDPKYASAYYHGDYAYYYKGDYKRAWEDVRKAQRLGYPVSPEFLKKLREASGMPKAKGVN
jgi:tetratricopeptide (TPR) repeat protein